MRGHGTDQMQIPRERFDVVTMIFHWLTVGLVLAQFATGFATAYVDDTKSLERVLLIHRSLGASILALTGMRLTWRLWFAYLPPFPANMPKIQQWAATANEYSLYALLFVQPVTGLGDSLFRGKSFAILGIIVPPLLPRTPQFFKFFHEAHELGADALLALIGLHAAAALFHYFVLRDRVLQRMLPGI